jgi:hypothetical protein
MEHADLAPLRLAQNKLIATCTRVGDKIAELFGDGSADSASQIDGWVGVLAAIETDLRDTEEQALDDDDDDDDDDGAVG